MHVTLCLSITIMTLRAGLVAVGQGSGGLGEEARGGPHLGEVEGGKGLEVENWVLD